MTSEDQEKSIAAAASAKGLNASGHTDPIWYTAHGAAAAHSGHAAVKRDLEADICVVGAGIAGLTTAYLLAKAGKSVIVVDEKPVGGGETGRTSAHLASAIDDRFYEIERIHGVEGSRVQHESHAAAINFIERTVKAEKIDCDFRRLDAFLFAGEKGNPKSLQDELEAAQRAGFPDAQILEGAPAEGRTPGPCLVFPNQARFDPLRYLNALSRCLKHLGVKIYIGSRIADLTGGDQVIANTQAGQTIRASAGVAATNVPSPVNNWAGIYLKMAAYRTYMVGLRVPRGAITDALYWDMDEPYHYARLVPGDADAEGDVLIVGGEDHRTGQHTDPAAQEAHFKNLEAWSHEIFPVAGELISRWSGQVNEPDDGVAFIGRVPTSGMENVYVITGDSGMGLTHGTLGAMLVSDLILGKTNSWEALYDPARTKLKAVPAFVAENVKSNVYYADYVTPAEVSSPDEIPNGEGALLRKGLTKTAAYRGPRGGMHECSAVCPHLKGIVHWNSVEKSWDCPVHGSRFAATGEMIIGPAIDDLSNA